MTEAVSPKPDVACFVSGTLIETEGGPVRVEELREGQRLLTHAGGSVRLERLLWRRIDLSAPDADPALMPIRIKAGALGEGVPHRDLCVSGEHALLLDGVLIPAGKLVNGGTVLREEVAAVTYFHLDCEGHAILVANGAAAESFLDLGNAAFFADAGVVTALKTTLSRAELRSRLAAPWFTEAALSKARAALLARAEAMGYRPVVGAGAAREAMRPRRVA